MTKLTHLDDAGNAAMVDITAKDATVREAVAEGRISMSAEALAAIKQGVVKKGDVLANEPEVLEVHHVAGQDSYLVKVRVKDPESLGRLLRERFGAISTVRSTQSTIALETLKETWALPVPASRRMEKARG